MAVTADVVQVRLEANTTEYLRNLKIAESSFFSTMRKLGAEAVLAGNALDIVGRKATESVTVAQAEINRFNTGNIAAQFQDIGVTAAGGMNPLIIALQQGTQLSAVLNAEIGKGVNPVRALGGAFLQVINPISLATIAAVALGAALLQSLGNVLPVTETANEALKRHKEELEDIVRGYGDAEDAVKEYFDQLQSLPQFAVQEGLAEQFKELEEIANSLPAALDAVVSQISYLGDGATDTDRKILELIEGFREGDVTLEELYSGLGTAADGMNLLEQASTALGIRAASSTEELRTLLGVVVQFGNEYDRFLARTQIALGSAPGSEDLKNALDLRAYIAEQERLNGLTTEELNLEKEIARIKADAGEFGITESEALRLAQETLAAEKARADLKKQGTLDDRAGTKAANEYERERQAVLDLMEAMGLEAAILGQSNREKAIAIALSKANATATQEELNTISQTAGFIYDTEQAVKKLNETSVEWANTVQSATRGFIDDLIAGKSAAEAFSNVLADIGSKLLDFGLNNLFGSSGFNLAGIFGNVGFPSRATGGNVYAGNPTMINERGQEIFIPTQPGRMVPASQVGGGGSVTFAPTIDARGADVAAVARLEGVVQKLAADVVPAIRREIATTNKKGRTRG